MTHGGEQNEEDIPQFEGQVVFQGDYEPLTEPEQTNKQQTNKSSPSQGPFRDN